MLGQNAPTLRIWASSTRDFVMALGLRLHRAELAATVLQIFVMI